MQSRVLLCVVVLAVILSVRVSGRPQSDKEHVMDKLDKLHHQMPEEVKKFFEGPKSVIKKTCWNDTEISIEKLRGLHTGEFDNVDNATKCFLHCVFKGMGMVKEDQLDLMAMTTMMEKMAPPPMAARTKKAIEHCKDTAGTDMCDTSMKFLKCAYMYDKETINAF